MSSNGAASDNSSFAAFFDGRIELACTILSSTEFLFYALSFPLELLFWRILYETTILHRNLKCLLFAQSLYVCGYALTRVYALTGALASGTVFVLAPQLVLFANYFFIVFGNLVGHALIIERILATVWVKGYENYAKWDFTAAWIVCVIPLSALNAFYQIYVVGSITTVSGIAFFTHLGAMSASFAEIFIMALITYLNEKKFKMQEVAIKNNAHTLTVRYQLAENIRTGRQLGPTFLFHFLSVLFSFCIVVNSKYQIVASPSGLWLVFYATFLLQAASNFMLSLSTIIFHPKLNQNAREVLRRLFLWAKLSDGSNNTVAPIVSHRSTIVRERVPATGDAYLRQLRTAWGDRPK